MQSKTRGTMVENNASTRKLICGTNHAVIRIIISVAMAAALVIAPMGLGARSCILSSAPIHQACKPRCCANKACCATSSEHKSSAVQPLAKADSNYNANATSITLVVAFSPSSESGAQLSPRFNAVFGEHSLPPLALTCIRLI
jgi:hypothetical protein